MIRFSNLDNVHVPGLLVAPFDAKIDKMGYESDLEDKLFVMHVHLKANALFKGKNLCRLLEQYQCCY